MAVFAIITLVCCIWFLIGKYMVEEDVIPCPGEPEVKTWKATLLIFLCGGPIWLFFIGLVHIAEWLEGKNIPERIHKWARK